MRLPEKIRRALEKTVKVLSAAENVYGVGLFGSWSRGDADSTSDVDLFILDAAHSEYEYVERIERSGVLIDLDHVPKKWIHRSIPSDVDQKLYEMQVLYDRDWSLTSTKLLVSKSYDSPERVEIRTETHVVDSDIYLSRATSALSREDFGSAYLFSAVALESALKVLFEIALVPFSSSRFLAKAEESASKLGCRELFDEYSALTGLSNCEIGNIKEKLLLFKAICDEASLEVKRNIRELDSSHFKVKTRLKYLLNPIFLKGVILRVNSMVELRRLAEASHYLRNMLLDIVENYVWLKSSINNVKVDSALLINCLRQFEIRNSRNFLNVTRFLDLDSVDKAKAKTTVDRARSAIVKIRSNRKALIKNHLSRG